MIIKTETTVSFDPVREFQAILDFERDHEDWQKIDDSTIATYFVKTDIVSVELKGEQE